MLFVVNCEQEIRILKRQLWQIKIYETDTFSAYHDFNII